MIENEQVQDNTELLENEIIEQQNGEENEVEPIVMQENEQEETLSEEEVKPEEREQVQYDAFVMPEGLVNSEELSSEFVELAHSMELPQESAQQLVNLAAKQMQSHIAEQAQQWADTRKEWVAQIKADPKLGGTKINETLERAQRSLRTFGTPELTSVFEDSGLGDNPHLIRFLAHLDKTVSEDSCIDGDAVGSSSNNKSLGEVWYPRQK